jgi:hypothetical protein
VHLQPGLHMSKSTSIEIECAGCGGDALLIREPVYEGFQKTGEILKCSACGHTYATEEEVPFKHRRQVEVFTDEDRSPDPELFDEGEASGLCRYCANYVVNPFMQWCGLHRKEVQATDSCDRFERKLETEEKNEDENSFKPPIF